MFPIVSPCLALGIHPTVAGKVAAEKDLFHSHSEGPLCVKTHFCLASFRSFTYDFDDLLVCLRTDCFVSSLDVSFLSQHWGILSHFSLTTFSVPLYCSEAPIVHIVTLLKVTHISFERSSRLYSLRLFSLGPDGFKRFIFQLNDSPTLWNSFADFVILVIVFFIPQIVWLFFIFSAYLLAVSFFFSVCYTVFLISETGNSHLLFLWNCSAS